MMLGVRFRFELDVPLTEVERQGVSRMGWVQGTVWIGVIQTGRGPAVSLSLCWLHGVDG